MFLQVKLLNLKKMSIWILEKMSLHKSLMSAQRKLDYKKPTTAITTVPVAQNNFVMDEDGDEIQRMLREAENNLDLDPALRD